MTPPITPACSDTAPLPGTARQELFCSGLSCDRKKDRKKEHILCTREEEEVLFPHCTDPRCAETPAWDVELKSPRTTFSFLNLGFQTSLAKHLLL